MVELDHLAVAAETLEAGRAHVEQALGVALQPGGTHARFGTHNMLLGLEDGLYLEVIAVDPNAPAPQSARWFDLDRFAGPPRVSNWICRCDDLDAALARSPEGSGAPVALERGDLRWRMAVPGDGILPFGGCFPALMQWQGAGHPAARLAPSGCRLERLVLSHPRAGALRTALAPLLDDARLVVEEGPAAALVAEFDTPHGRRSLA